MSRTRIEQLFLLTADLDRARSFYERGLNLEPSEVGETSVAYETGGSELKLQADFPPEVLESFNLSSPPADGRGAGAVYVLSVPGSLEAAHDRLLSAPDAAGEVLIEPQEVPWGGRMFLARDPDGYVLEIRSADESA